MTSNINTINIDEEYPISGRDNDSQGFRDNFKNINIQLNRAKSEITELQSTAVLTGVIGNNSAPATTDLHTSTIVNGTHNKFYGTFYQAIDTNSSGAIEIDLNNGTLQRFRLMVDTSIVFKNWPAAIRSAHAKVTVHLILDGTSEQEVADITSIATNGFPTSAKHAEIEFPVLHVSKTSEIVFEAWSYNGGASFFVKYIGEFQAGA